MKSYNAYVQFGKGRSSRKLWVQNAKWVGDSVVITFGDEPSVLPAQLASGACSVALVALSRRHNYVSTGSTLVENLDLATINQYRAFLDLYDRTCAMGVPGDE